jgi:hypothetical protein
LVTRGNIARSARIDKAAWPKWTHIHFDFEPRSIGRNFGQMIPDCASRVFYKYETQYKLNVSMYADDKYCTNRACLEFFLPYLLFVDQAAIYEKRRTDQREPNFPFSAQLVVVSSYSTRRTITLV